MYQTAFNRYIIEFIDGAYKHYKPIGVATTAEGYIQPPEENNLAGVFLPVTIRSSGKN